MAALTAAGTQPYSASDAMQVAFGGADVTPGSPGQKKPKEKSPKGFVASVLTSNRALFIFSEENFIRKCAKWITEWPYPFYTKILLKEGISGNLVLNLQLYFITAYPWIYYKLSNSCKLGKSYVNFIYNDMHYILTFCIHFLCNINSKSQVNSSAIYSIDDIMCS